MQQKIGTLTFKTHKLIQLELSRFVKIDSSDVGFGWVKLVPWQTLKVQQSR